MSCALHGQENCPLCHPEPRRPDPPPEPNPFNLAVGLDGNPLSYNAEEVHKIAEYALDQGDLLFGVFRMPAGDLAVTAFGPPSAEMVDILEQVAAQFRRVVELQVGPLKDSN